MAPEERPGRETRRPSRRRTDLCSWRFEDEAARQGLRLVAGLDEVGRGALCGPVVACAVILGSGFDTGGIDDSKLLTCRQRETLATRIKEHARAWALGVAESAEIDRLNILRATHLAMRRSLTRLGVSPDLVLVDGLPVTGLDARQRAVVRGDHLSFSIAAASIVAKVARDRMMCEWDRQYPGYGLAHNMGYASEDHRIALRRLGPSRIHRRSFHGTERWLFELPEPGKAPGSRS